MELIKGGGEQTPHDDQTSAIDMMSRQSRDDLARVGKFGRCTDHICSSTLGWKAGATKKTTMAGWRYMKHPWWPSARRGRHGSQHDATAYSIAVCHGNVKPYSWRNPTGQEWDTRTGRYARMISDALNLRPGQVLGSALS